MYRELFAAALLPMMLIGTLFTLIIGLVLLLAPQRFHALEERLNRWISLRRTLKPLEKPYQVDARLYRLHRPLGLFILLSCTYILYQLAFHYDARTVALLFATGDAASPINDWLAEALLLIGIIVNLLLIPFGALLALRPSSLKGFETWANRWISTRQSLQLLDRSSSPVDALVKRHPRLTGGLILGFSLNSFYFFLLQMLKNAS